MALGRFEKTGFFPIEMNGELYFDRLEVLRPTSGGPRTFLDVPAWR